MAIFSKYSAYYDLFYKDKDYSKESNYVLRLLSKFSFIKLTSLLELGFGTANHAHILSPKFSKIFGIEKSEEMVELSRKKNIPNFFPCCGDIKEFSCDCKVDAVISLFHVISYLNENKDLLSCFSSVSTALNPGGIFLFDTWFTPAVLTQFPTIRIKRFENDNFKITRLAEPLIHFDNNVVDVNYEIQFFNKTDNSIEIIHETHPMRHFSIPEIKLIAAQTGFEFVHAEAFLTGEKVSANSWGVCFILRKI